MWKQLHQDSIFYYIPSVLNSRKVEWVTGVHHEALKEFGDIMDWDEILWKDIVF